MTTKNTNSSKLVAIVVPLFNRPNLTAEEQISLNHLLHYLENYDKYFVAPTGLDIQHSELQNKYFGHEYFGSPEAHSKLLLSTLFYEAFIDYEYILIYHLDSLVFSDKLTEWCQKGYDYIAAPWIKHEEAPYAGVAEFEGKIGNGGFSLRRVKNFLKVINSNNYSIDPDEYWRLFCENRPIFKQIINLPKKYLMRLPQVNNVKREIEKKSPVEDMFWANRGSHYYPEFKIAPLEAALRFAFECVPRYCFERNNFNLPFGCHAWQKYDREFWEPYLLK